MKSATPTPTLRRLGARARIPAGVALVAAVIAGVTACGTTVPHDQVVAANGGLSVAGDGTTTAADGTIVPGSDGASADTAGTTTGGGSTGSSGTAGTDGTAGTAGTTGSGGGAEGASGTSSKGGSGAAGSGGVPGNIITASCSGTGSGTIKIGNSEPYSAAGANPSEPMIGAMQAWEDYVNSHGGICGRKVEMIIKDDANSASKVSANYKELVESDKVAAIVNAVTATNASAFVPYVTSKKMPIVGGDMATGDWHKNPVFFPATASVGEKAVAQYKLVQREPKGDKVAFLYCAEVAACSDNYHFQADNDLPGKVGSEFVYAKQISLTQVSFASECQAAADAGAGVILAYGDAGLVERLAQSCAQQGLEFTYLTVTYNDSMESNQYLDGHTYSVTGTQSWAASNTPGIQFITSVLASAGVPVNGTSVQHFVNMLMLQQAITYLGDGEVTPATVMKSLQTNIKNYDMGGVIGPVTFGAGAQAQGTCTGGSMIDGGHWVATDGGALGCRQGSPLPLP